MKIITATFEAENELAEHLIWKQLEGLNGKYIRTHPSTEHLKEDKAFIKLTKAVKDAKKHLYDYIFNHK